MDLLEQRISRIEANSELLAPSLILSPDSSARSRASGEVCENLSGNTQKILKFVDELLKTSETLNAEIV
jgi:hypothetical protein